MPKGKTPEPSGGLRSTDLEPKASEPVPDPPKPRKGKCCVGDPECDCGGYGWESVEAHQPNVCAGPHRRDWKQRAVTK